MEPWTLLLCMWTLTLSVIYLTDYRKACFWKAIVYDTKKQLYGLRQSKLEGYGGLAAATMRENLRLIGANDYMHAEIRKLQSADWYWEVGEDESGTNSILGLMDQYDPGDIAEVQPVHDLPRITVERTEDGYRILTDKEEKQHEA